MILQPVAHDVPRGLTTLTKPVPRGTGEHVARLIRWFEDTFDCREGLRRAWTSVPATTAEAQRITALSKTEGVRPGEPGAWTNDDLVFSTEFFARDRGHYAIFGYGALGLYREKELCDTLCGFFQARLTERAAITGYGLKEPMYWRRKPEFRNEVAQPECVRHGVVVFDAYPDRCALDMRACFPTLTGLDSGAYCPDGGGVPYTVLKP